MKMLKLYKKIKIGLQNILITYSTLIMYVYIQTVNTHSFVNMKYFILHL